MADDVKMTFTGNSSDAERAIAALERKYEALENRMKRTKATSKKAASESKNDFDGLASSIVKATTTVGALETGFGMLQRAATSIAKETEKFTHDMDKAASKWRESSIKFEVQADMDPAQAKRAMDNAVGRAMLTPVLTDTSQIANLNTQLSSAGFKRDDIESGAAVAAVFDMQAAMNAYGEGMTDPARDVRAISQLLKGEGIKEPTAADVRGLGMSLTEVFAESEMQMRDFEPLAPKTATLQKFGLDRATRLAAFSTAGDIMGGDKAATGLTAVVTRLGAAGNIKERTEALAEVGLKPEDVAMAEGGLSFLEGGRRFRDAVKPLTQEHRNRLFTKLFGEEGQGTASALFSEEGWATVERRHKELQEPDIAEKNLKRFQQSDFAKQQRLALRKADAERQTLEFMPITWGDTDAALAADMAESRLAVQKRESIPGRVIGHATVSAYSAAKGTEAMIGRNLGVSPEDMQTITPTATRLVQGAGGGLMGMLGNTLVRAGADQVMNWLRPDQSQPAMPPVGAAMPQGPQKADPQ